MEVQGRSKRGRHKKRWLAVEELDCRGRKCRNETHGGVYHHTLTNLDVGRR